MAANKWLSFDHGASWTYVGVVQSSSGGIGAGIWEPFVTLDSSGHLALFFSDERQHATYSQFIGEIISTDGGLTWTANPDGSTNYGPGEIQVVASPYPADRAGMATVAQMGSGGGDYALSYEMCGPQNCAVHVKTSTTGNYWGPTDLGTVPTTSNGLFLQGTPVITWVENGGVNGTLYLSGRMEASTSGSVPQNQTVILANAVSGTGPVGPWSWLAAPPIPTTGGNPTLCGSPNYSPDLMVSRNGTSLLYTTAAVTGPRGCRGDHRIRPDLVLEFLPAAGRGRDQGHDRGHPRRSGRGVARAGNGPARPADLAHASKGGEGCAGSVVFGGFSADVGPSLDCKGHIINSAVISGHCGIWMAGAYRGVLHGEIWGFGALAGGG